MNAIKKCNEQIVKICKTIFENSYMGFEDNNSFDVLNIQMTDCKMNEEKILVEYHANLTKNVKNQENYEKFVNLYETLRTIDWISDVKLNLDKWKINFNALIAKEY